MQGFLNVNKKSGVTSAKVVNVIKKTFHIDKVGHMGTLDPMACGILPIAIGKATKMFDYFLNKYKKYVAVFEFGYTTDTLDATGIISNKNGYIPSENEVCIALKSMVGKYEQLPPLFSAKNINGKRAYEYAREGKNVELTKKTVEVKSFSLLEKVSDNGYKFEIECGSGTYIRSLARDLAEKLNTYACMTYLQRTESGVFCLDNSIKLDELDNIKLNDILISIPNVFPNIKKITISVNDKIALVNGRFVSLHSSDDNYFVFCENQLLGLGKVTNNLLKLSVHLYE